MYSDFDSIEPMYTVILFYKYLFFEDPEKERDRQKGLCEKLGLTGRIIVAQEGINGTLEGTTENINSYIETMRKDERFRDVDFKASEGTGEAFPRLSVKVRPEIVSSHLTSDIDPRANTGEHLDPEELKEWYAQKKDFTVIDMRNDYEYASGRFKKSVHPGMKNFRDLREDVSQLEHLKEKPVVTVCTGGVRCEKASAFLKEKGFKHVYQLKGGMHRYMEKYPGEDFDGTLYVFDQRKTMSIAPESEREIVGRCVVCEGKSENYVDCREDTCPGQFIYCEQCLSDVGKPYCGGECAQKQPMVQHS